MLHDLVPEHAQATGLLALMLLTEARRPARTGAGGLVPHLDADPLTRHRERAVRAHLTEETGDPDGAARLYREVAALTANEVEKRHLTGRARRLDRSGDAVPEGVSRDATSG
jgi:predicted RNA polymerase sigma factor